MSHRLSTRVELTLEQLLGPSGRVELLTLHGKDDTPSVSKADEARLYYDVDSQSLMLSTNGSAYQSLSAVSLPQDLDVGDSPTFVGLTLSGLSGPSLVATDSGGELESVASLTAWIAGTSNQITVTDDTDGTVTLSLPQDIHTGASPEFESLTLSDLTQGGVLFAGEDGVVSQDASNFFWDDIHNWLGINTDTPQAHLHMITEVFDPVEIMMDAYDFVPAVISGRKARGTQDNPSKVFNREDILRIDAYGHDGTNFHRAASILMRTAQIWGTGARGTSLLFSTTANNTTTMTTRLQISENGKIGIGEYVVSSPTYDLSFSAIADRTFAIERGNARTLTVMAGGATSSASDADGGDLILSGGISTGTGTSKVQIQVALPANETGTADNSPETVAEFDAAGGSGETHFLLYDVATSSLQRVKVGSNSTGPGGTGRALYIDDT